MLRSPQRCLATISAILSLAVAGSVQADGHVAAAGPCASEQPPPLLSGLAIRLLTPQDVAAGPPPFSSPPGSGYFNGRAPCDLPGSCGSFMRTVEEMMGMPDPDPDPPTNPPIGGEPPPTPDPPTNPPIGGGPPPTPDPPTNPPIGGGPPTGP
jgi:hypothetical protein